MMTTRQFAGALASLLSPLVLDGRYVLADETPHLGPEGPGRASVTVTFVNLPLERVRQRRGGGAESENNRMLFMVRGFNAGPTSAEGVERVQVEQLVNHVGDRSENMRKKTGTPERVAEYLAEYVNRMAASHKPRLTHE